MVCVILRDLGLQTILCVWVLDILTGRSQCFLYTSDCVATLDSNTIVNFADETVVLGLISNNDEVGDGI